MGGGRMSGIWVGESCQLCGSFRQLETHHIFNQAYKKKSEKYGFLLTLCNSCHTGRKDSVHNNADLRKELKRMAQTEFEKTHSREEFISEFGRNYLMED